MIELRNVSRAARVGGALTPVLEGVTFDVPHDARLMILSGCPVTRNTLLNLMAGLERPDEGEISRVGRISFPIGRGLGAGMGGGPGVTGAELCRIHAGLHGLPAAQVEAACYDASELGPQFFEPIETYTPGRKARLTMALVLALDFNIHLIDGGIPHGRRAGQPEVARRLERRLEETAVVIFTDNPANALARRFCDRAAVAANGAIREFDRVQHAKAFFRNAA